MVMRVAVIGCGAAGLCALRHLTARPNLFKGVGFELQSGVGGTWKYTDKVGNDKNGFPVQSSMYKNLKTNIPKEVMAYPGFAFPSNLPSFIRHQDVLKYLEDYCYNYELEDSINFETNVERVEPHVEGAVTEWSVSYSNADGTEASITQSFDAVMVCNGHYSTPLFPKLDGMEEFTGTIIHSHDYRTPEPYQDQTVVCLGAAASGQDIGLDIATVARKVILSHNKTPHESPLPANVDQQVGIDRLTSDTVVFKNGLEEKVDTLMLTTGYRYTFPFLSEVCSVNIEDERITPLYKHIIHSQFPTLSFIGMCKIICPFPQFDTQIRYVLSLLDGTQRMPTREEMEEDTEADFQNRLNEGLPVRHAHLMGPRQWDYNKDLAKLGKFEAVPESIRMLYDEVHRTRVLDLPNYKTKVYKLTGDNSFEELFEESKQAI